MVGKISLLAAIAAGFWAYGAQAATVSDISSQSSAPRISGTAGDGVRLAQADNIEVYFDGNGNRVIVDSYTGKIIAIQPPRSVIGGQDGWRGARLRDARRGERYYDGDAEEAPRYSRERRWQQERYPEPPIDDYGDYTRGPNDFPPAPQQAFPGAQPYPDDGYDSEPQVVRRDPITRAPLEVPVARAPEGQEPTTVIEVPEVDDGTAVAPPTSFTAREDVASIQILMDRAGASPGVIDGKFGSNVDKALAAYRDITGTNLKSTDTAEIKAALAATGGDPFVTYTITPEDAAGPFVASVPADYSEKAQLDHMSYTSVLQMLAARFHMDEGYLKSLNPEANFNRPGTILRVANINRKAASKVASIIADKGRKQVRAYDEAGKLVVAYPATIGSADTPSPTGTHAVSRVALNPNYTYNPKLNFKQGNNDKILTIPPGPNGPVGTVWIALDKPTYGIHGTPDPSKIGKTESHGCVRLTNWDAEQLAKLVSPGVPVEFIE
ncbi:L,D-transpeptidase [Mesorhizobium sp. KR1-2]|uniref:L,D-transpeptidase n=1 Tax=Mesorhizobium sp. KR1-2 TaxID=3156609 RepID=UPI0032B3E96D